MKIYDLTRTIEKLAKSYVITFILLVIYLNILSLFSLATINSVDVTHPTTDVTTWSDFYFEYKFVGSENNADCSLYIDPTNPSSNKITTKLTSNNTPTNIHPNEFDHDLASASSYKFIIRCNDSSSTLDSSQITFNVASGVLPKAKLYPLPAYISTNPYPICGYGGTKDVTINLYVTDANGTPYSYSSYSNYDDSVVGVSGKTVSENGKKGDNYIIVEDATNELDSSYESYYLEFSSIPRSCYLYYDIVSVTAYDSTHKKITISPVLENDVPAGTQIIFHSNDRPSGWFSINVNFVNQGSYSVSLRVNKSKIYSTDSGTTIFDSVAPTIDFTTKRYYNSDQNIYFNISDTTSGVDSDSITVNQTDPLGNSESLTVIDDGSGKYHVYSQFTDPGEYNFTIFVRDNAGNTKLEIYKVYYSSNAPQIVLNSSDIFNTKNVTLIYRYIGDFNASKCELYINGTLNQTKTNIENNTLFNYTFNVLQKSYEDPYIVPIKIQCTDLAGNVGTISHNINVSYLPFYLIWNYIPTYDYITWMITDNTSISFYGFSDFFNTTYNFTIIKGINVPKRKSITSLVNNPLINKGKVLENQAKGQCFFLVNSSTNPKINIGQGVRFKSHNLNDYTLYQVINYIDYSPIDKILYNITPCLQHNITSNETFYIYKYSDKPSGWFNTTLDLFPGVNQLNIQLYRYNELGYSEYSNVIIFDNFSPDIYYHLERTCSINPLIVLDVLSFSPIDFNKSWVNVSNTTSTVLYLNSSALKDLMNLSFDEYRFKYTLNLNESLLGSLNDSNYNITSHFATIFGKSSNGNVSFEKDSSILPVTNLKPTSNEVSTPVFEFEWNPAIDANDVIYNYTLYESVSDSTNDFVPVLTGSTNETNVSIYYSNAKINHGYKLEVYPIDACGNIGPKVNSSVVIYVDLTPPTNGVIHIIPSENYTNSPSRIELSWSFVDPESNNLTYEYGITDLEDNWLYGSPYYTTSDHVNITGLSLEHEKKYKVLVRARNPSNLWSEYYTKTFVVDLNPPENGSIEYTPGPLYYSNTISISIHLGTDDLSGVAKGKVFLMKAPLLVVGNNLICGNYNTGTVIKTVYSDTTFTQNLTNGYCYKLMLRSYDQAGNFRDFFINTDYYNGSIVVDTTKPSKVNVYDESFYTSTNSLFFNWTSSYDPESGIHRYIYYLKDSDGNTILTGETDPSTTQIYLTNLSLVNGMSYYLYVIAENNVGLQSDEASSDGILFLDRIPPEKARIHNISAINYSNIFYDLSATSNTTLYINVEPGASCIYSDKNLGYTDIYKLGDCTSLGGSLMKCILPTLSEGVYTFYIACKDANGNKQDKDETLRVDVIKSYNSPKVNIDKPEHIGNTLFSSERDELWLNITTFSPLDSVTMKIYNSSSVLLYKTLLFSRENESLYKAYRSLDLTSFVNNKYNLTINITDIFNRSIVNDYDLIIVRDKPTFIIKGLLPYYNRSHNTFLNATFYLFNNISLIIKNSDKIVFNYTNSSSNRILEQNLIVPMNLTNETWSDDNYTLSVYMFNNLSKISENYSYNFIVDNQSPNIEKIVGPSYNSTYYDNTPLRFRVYVSENKTNSYNSGIKEVILHYNVSNRNVSENFSKSLIFVGESEGVEIWETTLPQGTLKPGSFVNYSFMALDFAGNSRSSSIFNFTIENRLPYFVTAFLSTNTYQNVKTSYRIHINDPDINKNLSCNLYSTYPSFLYSNVSVTTLNNSECKIELLVNYTGYMNFTINLSDGINSTFYTYNVTVNPTEKVSLDLDDVHHLMEIKARFNDTFVTEGRYQSSVNVTLPKENTSLIFASDGVKITTDTKPYNEFDGLKAIFLSLPPSTINANNLNLGKDKRYKPKASYVIEFNKPMNYTITFNYSDLISNPDSIKLFKIKYDYDTDFINYSNYIIINNFVNDKTRHLITFVISNFSVFVLSEDSENEPVHTSSHKSSRGFRGSSRIIKRVYATCNDSIKNQDETDVDCGGSCSPCENSKHCLNDSDCLSNYCDPEEHICTNKPSCDDGIKNQDETDIDCGGSCGKCADGKRCLSNNDCISNYCYNNICRTPTCNDGIKNQDETDVDCGGLHCDKCLAGKHCLSNYDCVSKHCINNMCVEATCDDGIKNQDETDVDCGGLHCDKCPDLKVCNKNSDCISNYCYNNICRTPTCNDGIKNQDEEGIDCGGPCEPCNQTIQHPSNVYTGIYQTAIMFGVLLLSVVILIVILLRKNSINVNSRLQGQTNFKKSRIDSKGKFKIKDETLKDKRYSTMLDNLSLSEEDKKIIIEYIRNLVRKVIKEGKSYYYIKALLINKGYTHKEFLDIAKQEYIYYLKERIKKKILEFRKKGFTDNEIIQEFMRLGFSEDEAKEFLQM